MYTAVECFDQRELLRWAQRPKFGAGKYCIFFNNGSATISCTENSRTPVIKGQEISEVEYDVVALPNI